MSVCVCVCLCVCVSKKKNADGNVEQLFKFFVIFEQPFKFFKKMSVEHGDLKKN